MFRRERRGRRRVATGAVAIGRLGPPSAPGPTRAYDAMWNFPLFPEQASTIAGRVDRLFLFELAIVLFFTALICFLILFFAVRYRRGVEGRPLQPAAHEPLAGGDLDRHPAGALARACSSGRRSSSSSCTSRPATPSRSTSSASSGCGTCSTPRGEREINELHVPLGRPVKLTMTSQDVIHSFFVPAFRIKQDVLPGRYTTLWFQPTKVGRLPPVLRRVLRHEPLGDDRLGRGDGAGRLRALAVARAGSGPSMAEEGERAVRPAPLRGCHGAARPSTPRGSKASTASRCRSRRGKDVRFVTADDRYIRDSILLPKSQVVAGYEPVMPSFQGQISEDDLLKIIAYIKSIGHEGGGPMSAAPATSRSRKTTSRSTR